MNVDLADMARLAGWAYLVIFSVAAGDAVLPVLPGETVVILGGVLASQGDLSVLAVFAVGALGAAVGDNVSYEVGKRANRAGRSPDELPGRFGKALVWAEAALESRGSTMIVVGRFIPGGRTALTFSAGYVRYGRLRFTASTILAGIVWSAYATSIGYLGGQIFEEKWWAGLAAGLALSFAVSGVIELVRKARGNSVSISETRSEIEARRRREAAGDPGTAASEVEG